MALGPVDFIVVKFPGEKLSGDVVNGIRDLVIAGTIRIIDLLFIGKNVAGEISTIELGDLDDAAYATWDAIVSDVAGYLTEADAVALADTLEPGHSAVLALIENAWAQRMVQAIQAVDGDVLISERIPRQIVDDLVSQH